METVLRVAFVYVFILALMRGLGKRELSEMSPFELVMLLLIPELVSQALVREDFSMTNAVIAVATLLSLVFITSALSYRFKWFETIVEGKPTMLGKDGKLISESMDRERVSGDEIMAEMRKSGVARLEEVKWIVLETDGRIAVVAHDRTEVRSPAKDELVK